MKMISRKLTFQLTPLLDLLLIVIFAQYMEVQEQTTKAEKTAEAKLANLDKQTDKNKTLEDQLAQALQDLAMERLSSAETQAELRRENSDLKDDLRHLEKQQNQVAELVAKMFKVPKELLEQLGMQGGNPPSQAELAELKKKFDELAKAQSKEVVKHVIAHEELRKRCDIWEVNVDEKLLVSFHTEIGRDGQVAGTFRYFSEEKKRAVNSPEALRRFQESTVQSFSDQLYELYKSQSQPKSLVIVLFSYDIDIGTLPTEYALEGLRRTVERMARDSQGRTRFDYATIGFKRESTNATN